MNVLAIDQGTSATKALVVADGGRVLGAGSAPVHPKAGPAGAVEQDPEELLDSIVAAGRAALEAAGEPVDAVGVGNQGETVLRWDRATGATGRTTASSAASTRGSTTGSPARTSPTRRPPLASCCSTSRRDSGRRRRAR